MIDLIRGLVDRPLDPRHARAVVAVASCLTFAFALLVALGIFAGPQSTSSNPEASPPVIRPTAPPPLPIGGPSAGSAGEGQPIPTFQDPQDRRGSAAFRRAHRAAREDRALQLLPFRGHGVRITLVGADHGRAVIRIEAATVAAAKSGWRGFLRRAGDEGRSYEPRFAGTRRRREDRGPARGPNLGVDRGRSERNGLIRHPKRVSGEGDSLKSHPQSKASQ